MSKFQAIVDRVGDPGGGVLAVPHDESPPSLPVTWVTVRASGSSDDVVAVCGRCKVRLFFPAHTPAPRFDDLLTGFCIDHRHCQEKR